MGEQPIEHIHRTFRRNRSRYGPWRISRPAPISAWCRYQPGETTIREATEIGGAHIEQRRLRGVLERRPPYPDEICGAIFVDRDPELQGKPSKLSKGAVWLARPRLFSECVR